MESRRVTLLTEGYLLGWLNFEYPQPFSKLRENYILQALERKHFKDLMFARVQMDSSLVSGAINKKTIDIPYDRFSSLLELTLPYVSKQVKINKEIEDKKHALTPENMAIWAATLAELKKTMVSTKPEKLVDVIPVQNFIDE